MTDQSKEEKQKLSEAVRLVRQAVDAEQKRLEGIARTEEASPVMVEGNTASGYFAQTMADPAIVAKVMLKHNSPLWKVLEEDYPQEMWDELAEIVGLDSVSGVDL